jgi:histidinol dehydrogenase
MIRALKEGRDPSAIAADQSKIRASVEGIIEDVRARGDAAVRELSIRFDKWDRKDFRLTDAEIQSRIAELSRQNRKDIRFAQDQVRNFAQHQRATPLHRRPLGRKAGRLRRPCRASECPCSPVWAAQCALGRRRCVRWRINN